MIFKTLILSFLFISLSFAGGTFTGKVVGVSDGDTFKILRNGKEAKVRLYGIDAPEKSQAFGQKSKKFASDLAYGKKVNVRIEGTDRYGRTIGEVFLQDGTNVNHEMVKAGFAWWYRHYAKDNTTLESYEAIARNQKLGLWSDENPIPPWEFRKSKKPKTKTEFYEKNRCTAITKNGDRCKRNVKDGQLRCWQHR